MARRVRPGRFGARVSQPSQTGPDLRAAAVYTPLDPHASQASLDRHRALVHACTGGALCVSPRVGGGERWLRGPAPSTPIAKRARANRPRPKRKQGGVRRANYFLSRKLIKFNRSGATFTSSLLALGSCPRVPLPPRVP